MTVWVLFAVVLVLAATIVWQNERQYRERREIAEQIDGLLQRIQAPEHAVIAKFNSDQPDDGVQAVNEFDDETYWLSREELAERVGQEERVGVPGRRSLSDPPEWDANEVTRG